MGSKKANLLGDCYVILDFEGRVWTGKTWSARRADAKRFGSEPDPRETAQRSLDRLRCKGFRCELAYMGADQVADFFADLVDGNGDGKPVRKSAPPTSSGR